MPTILGLDQQQKALKWIQVSLKDLAVINEFLSVPNPSGKYLISFQTEDGKRQTVNIVASNEEMEALILKSKDLLRAEVIRTAERYHIGFDEEDKRVIGA